MEVIESSNDDGGTISISNLFRKLENRFEEINFIEFVSLNGKKKQKIEYQYPRFEGLTGQQMIKYVPEFLNIEFNTNNYDSKEYRPNITIKYI